jgi:hypothetical protein
MTARNFAGVSVRATLLAPISRAELPEILVLVLQLDHLELTSDGQPMELLQLGHPSQRSRLLSGNL